MANEPRIVLVIWIGVEIMMMSVGRCSQQVGKFGLVLEDVGAVMLRLEVNAKPEHGNARCKPRQEDGCRCHSLQRPGHSGETPIGRT